MSTSHFQNFSNGQNFSNEALAQSPGGTSPTTNPTFDSAAAALFMSGQQTGQQPPQDDVNNTNTYGNNQADQILNQGMGMPGGAGGVGVGGMDQYLQQMSASQQAEAAYAAAAMAEKRMAMNAPAQPDQNDPIQVGASFGMHPNNSLTSQAGLLNNPYSAMLYPGAQQMLLNGFGMTNPLVSNSSALQAGQAMSHMGVNLAARKAGKKSLSSTSGSGKRKKDKEKPKRPLSAYNWFFKYERARILESIEESKSKPEEEKENADKPSEGEKTVKKEDEEEKVTNSSNGEKSPEGEETSTSQSIKGEDQDTKSETPKDPITPTSAAIVKKKKPHGKIGFENLAKKIGQRWASLEKDKFVHYKKLADEDMKRYKQEMEVYLTKLQEVEAKEQVQTSLPQGVNLGMGDPNGANRGLNGNPGQFPNFANPQTMMNGEEAQLFAQHQQLQMQIQNLQHQQQLQQKIQQMQQYQRMQQDAQTYMDDKLVETDPTAKRQKIDNDSNSMNANPDANVFNQSHNMLGANGGGGGTSAGTGGNDGNVFGFSQGGVNPLAGLNGMGVNGIQQYLGNFNNSLMPPQNQVESPNFQQQQSQDGSNVGGGNDNMFSASGYPQMFGMGQ